MGLDVESSGARAGLPPGFWFLLGFRVCDELVGGEYSTCVQVWSRGSCHFWGTWLDVAEADGEFSRRSGRFAEPVSKVTPWPTFHFLQLMSVPTVPITMVKNSQLGLFNGLMKHTPRTAPTGGGESRLGGECAFRRDGFLPPQERRMGGGSVGRPPLESSIPIAFTREGAESPSLYDRGHG